MAAKPLDSEISESIIVDWRLGQLSQRKIADKHSVSNGMVAKLTKGVARDVSSIVSAGLQYQQALHTQDERIVSAVEQVVNEAARRLKFFGDVNMLAARIIGKKLEIDGTSISYADANAATSGLGKAKDNIFGKTPDTAIQINNAPKENTGHGMNDDAIALLSEIRGT